MNQTAASSPFGVPVYRSLWFANLVSHLGFVVQTVGAAWLMTQLAPSPKMVALVQTSNTLPIMLLALLAGAIADSFDRRLVMLVALGIMLIGSLVLAVLTACGWVTPWLLLACTFLIGCGMALRNPAWQATVGEIVPKPMLATAITYNSIAFNVARSGGPAIGGAIVAVAGSAMAFAVSCVSYLSLATALLRWKPAPKPADLPPERLGSALASGLRYFAMSPPLLRLLVRSALFAFASSAISALMPVIARDLMGGGALMFGLLLGAFGAGAVGGAFVTVRLRRHMGGEAIMAIASLVLAVGAAVSAWSTTIFLTLPALMLAGLGWILGMAILNAVIQLATPRWIVARAIAIQQTATFGGMAAGGYCYGHIADGYGIAIALAASAVLQLGVMLVGPLTRLPEVDAVNLEPSSHWSSPVPAVPVEGRDGPMAVSLTYRVEEARIAEFLATMRDWRRVRRRDGARRWRLYRDLADPQVWIERYEVANWHEYARHNQRRTHDDGDLRERILALQVGGYVPLVHRELEIVPARGGLRADVGTPDLPPVLSPPTE